MSPPVRTVVVDDEALARQALRRQIADVDWLEWVGEAEDGPAAVALIESVRPELLFLDVELPGLSGLDVLSRTEIPMVVVFTTAFEEYALAAFELGAIDYLKKPFGRSRLIRAVQRALPQLEALRSGRAGSAVPDSASLAARLTTARRDSALNEIFVRQRGSVVPIRVQDIVRLEADGDYVALHANGRRHLLYMNLGDLAARLESARFVRIHRSHVVNLAHLSSVAPVDADRAAVVMTDGARLVASRSGTRVLRQAMRQGVAAG
jgi:two-component system LytT family response regulator